MNEEIYEKRVGQKETNTWKFKHRRKRLVKANS